MSIETWGEMNKSQIDATKIEERIAEMIAEHEADPEAHLGTGESLESHRANEIIDHPAGSVVADKYTDTEMIWQSFFTSSSNFNNYGTYNYFSGGGVDIMREFASGVSQVSANPYDGNITVTSASDFTAQYTVNLGRDGNTSRFLLGVTENISTSADSQPSKGFYFECINNSMRGKVRLSGTTYQTDAFTPPNWEFIILRIFWDHTTKTVSFYVNGALLGSIEISTFSGLISYPLMARVETTDADNLYVMALTTMSFTRYFAPLF